MDKKQRNFTESRLFVEAAVQCLMNNRSSTVIILLKSILFLCKSYDEEHILTAEPILLLYSATIKFTSIESRR